VVKVMWKDENVKATLTALRAFGDTAIRHLRPFVADAGEETLSLAQELAPVKEGMLRKSGDVRVMTESLAGLAFRIEFGAGLAGKYAFYQHQRQELAHTPEEFTAKFGSKAVPKKGYGGGQSHYLWGRDSKRGDSADQRLKAKRLHEFAQAARAALERIVFNVAR